MNLDGRRAVGEEPLACEAALRSTLAWLERDLIRVAGVPQALCDRLSTRSRERDDWLA